MKFEMKKRILALALAGTTAFSVFGSALSANAYYDSTHDQWNIDRYESYVPAGPLSWSDSSAATQYGTAGINFYVDNASLVTNADGSYLPTSRTIYVLSQNDKTNFAGKGYTVEILNGTKDSDTSTTPAADGYFATLDSFMDAQGYTRKTVAADGTIDMGGVKYYVATQGVGVVFGAESNFRVFTAAEWDTFKGTWTLAGNGFDVYIPDSIIDSTTGKLTISSYHNVVVPTSTLENGKYTANKGLVSILNQYSKSSGNPYFIQEYYTGNYTDYTSLDYLESTTRVVTALATNTNGISNGQDYTRLDSTDPTDLDAVLANPVQASGEVYLYDYYNELPNRVSVDSFTTAWNRDEAGKLLAWATGNAYGDLNPDSGRYSAKGVRAEVVDEWENFLDDLGIADATSAHLTAWGKRTVENYLYQYYDAQYVTSWTENPDGTWSVTITNGRNVDLYNFKGLIADILELAPAWKVTTAQTSEMVYLMQQYDKYMDGYVDPVPVETDEWGDLLVSLAQAPTEDEFATANGYKRYTNKVEDLVEAYEEADTAVAVEMAEKALFNFVSSYTSAYKYETKGDATELGNAIASTVFNYKWSGDEYYVGATDKDGNLDSGHVDTGITSTDNKVGLDAYAMYPYGDYEGSVMDGSYPGVDQPIYKVTQEYFWFYNVYTLAYNVYNGNKYQSTLDLMASTLNEAIDALVPSDNASAAEILGAEEEAEKLANLVDTDYQAGMWANRNQIYTYITERVSNDEIGSYGSTNAEEIAAQVADQLGYQKYQTTVTRSDINSVSAAKTEAQTALTNLRNDEENYNAAQANALQKAIDECDVIIDIFNGDYSKSKNSQSVNGVLNLLVGDKDQILKSDCTNAVQAVEDAINFKNVIMGWTDTDEGWKYGVNDADGPHYLNDGWHQVDGGKTWFYFDENGVAKESTWWQDPATGTWYYFNQNCGAAVGWCKIDGDWYYFKGNNAMKTGWEKVEGSWYYMNSSGKMVTGWCQINGTWYYFSKESNALGQMLANTTTPDGYKVDANGALVE